MFHASRKRERGRVDGGRGGVLQETSSTRLQHDWVRYPPDTRVFFLSFSHFLYIQYIYIFIYLDFYSFNIIFILFMEKKKKKESEFLFISHQSSTTIFSQFFIPITHQFFSLFFFFFNMSCSHILHLCRNLHIFFCLYFIKNNCISLNIYLLNIHAFKCTFTLLHFDVHTFFIHSVEICLNIPSYIFWNIFAFI